MKKLLEDIKRVLMVAKKPSKEELIFMAKVTGLGIIILGLIGFFVFGILAFFNI